MKKFENYCFERDVRTSINELAVAVCESGIPVEIVIEDLQHFMTLDVDLQEQAISELELINEAWGWGGKKDPTSPADGRQQIKDQKAMQAGLKRDRKTQDAKQQTGMMKAQNRADRMTGALKQGAATVGMTRDDGTGWGQKGGIIGKAWKGIKNWMGGQGQQQGQPQGQPQGQSQITADKIEKAIFPNVVNRMGASKELLDAVDVVKRALKVKK